MKQSMLATQGRRNSQQSAMWSAGHGWSHEACAILRIHLRRVEEVPRVCRYPLAAQVKASRWFVLPPATLLAEALPCIPLSANVADVCVPDGQKRLFCPWQHR